MSNQQNVWVGSINFTHVDIHPIGMSFPEVFDFPTYHYLQTLPNGKYTEQAQKKNEELNKKIVELQQTYRNFNKLPVFPDSLWLVYKDNPLPKKSEYIFEVRGGGLMLNEACANILCKFNLGQSTLVPLKIHQLDTKKILLEETFYFLNSCEQRNYVKKAQPEEYFWFNKYWRGVGTYRMDIEMADNYLQLDQSAVDCDVDLWHDPLFAMSYFFSERLHNALVEAGLDKKWNMHRCKLTSQ